ncbi:Flp pilus assembly protein CpaB [Planctomicrobium sp. SH664]|uniref:Flp pilus assembly protein CpaB n=1 Tax=Planctomicrobium sp. SH664 TaxID=3448125 RepID=UPI003F5C4162
MRRLSPALLTMGMLGVIGLLVAMYFGKKLLAREEAPQDPVVNVPMALAELKPGTRITEAHLGLGPIRQSKLTRDIVKTNRVLLGRIVKSPIASAQPISTNDLYPPGEGPPLALEPGMRAVTISLSSDDGVQPGQYVDVHFIPSSYPDSDDNGGLILTLFKGVKVLAKNGLSTGTSSSSRGTTTVTLELTPEQANIVLLAKDKGSLSLVYTGEGKGTGVVAVGDENRATLYQILGIGPKPEEPAPTPPFTTEIYPGASREVIRFKDGVRSYGDAAVGVGSGNPETGSTSGGSGRSRGGPPPSGRANTVPGPSAAADRATY